MWHDQFWVRIFDECSSSDGVVLRLDVIVFYQINTDVQVMANRATQGELRRNRQDPREEGTEEKASDKNERGERRGGGVGGVRSKNIGRD